MTRTIVHFFAAALITAVVASAQTPAPAICGRVIDQNKKPVPGAEILLWDGIVRHMSGGTADSHGHFCIAAYATEKGSSTAPYYSLSAMYQGPKGLQVQSMEQSIPEPQHKVLRFTLQIPYAVPSKSGK